VSKRKVLLVFVYRVHAIERMFQRDVSEEEVEYVVKLGETIESYLDDQPYPSCLVLGYVDMRPLHIVYAKDENNTVIIITVYEPTLDKWSDDFKTRRKQK
jgi:hypothetical protein